MRLSIPCAALGLTLVALTAAAAQPAPVYGDDPAPGDGPAGYDAPPVGRVGPAYQYVYEPHRILVVDPQTGIVMQALPR